MINIILAFPKPDDARSIKAVLVKNGLPVSVVCSTVDKVLMHADNLNSGIIVSGYRLADATYHRIARNMPRNFELLLIASPARWSGEPRKENVEYLATPFKTIDLIKIIRTAEARQNEKRRQRRKTPVKRSEEEQKLIDTAKQLLMEKNNLTEPEAHRYLQKISMDSGVSFVEAAGKAIKLFENEIADE